MAAQFDVGSNALNTSTGSQTISPAGLAFTPVAGLYIGNGQIADGGSDHARLCVGGAVSSTVRRASTFHDRDNQNTSSVVASALINATWQDTGANGAQATLLDFTSYNASPAGYTINISDAGLASILNHILFGGDITSAEMGTLDVGNSAGNKTLGITANPSVVFFWTHAAATSETLNLQALSARAALGWMCADGTQGFASTFHSHSAATSITARKLRSDRCFGLHTSTVDTIELNYVSMDPVTVNQNGVPAQNNTRVYFLALYGGTFTSVAFNSSTGTGDFDVLTPGVDPAFCLVQTVGAVSDTAIQTGGKRSIGFASSASKRATVAYDAINGSNFTNCSRYTETDRLLVSITAGNASPTVDDLYDLTSFGVEKVTVNHVTASGTAIEGIMLVGGEVASGDTPLTGIARTLSAGTQRPGISVAL